MPLDAAGSWSCLPTRKQGQPWIISPALTYGMSSTISYLHSLITPFRGSIIDVSWAVVQRSQGELFSIFAPPPSSFDFTGFLDGGDRSVTLDSLPTASAGPTNGFDLASNQANIIQPHAQTLADISNQPDFFAAFTSETSSTVIVSNIPHILFSQPVDLEPLL